MLVIVPKKHVKTEKAKLFGIDINGEVMTPPLVMAGLSKEYGLCAIAASSDVAPFVELHKLKVVEDRDLDNAPGWFIKNKPAHTEALTLPPISFSVIQQARTQKVDDKTTSVIASGFTVDGKIFSASESAQLKWLGMFMGRSIISYPIIVPTIDDKEFVNIASAEDVETYYKALLVHIHSALDSGSTIKKKIAVSTSREALSAIIDNRT